MSNKFQKSVLERLEAEEKRQKQPPADPKPNDKKTTAITLKETPSPVKNAAPTLQEDTAPTDKPGYMTPDLSAYLSHDEQRIAKNKTFYLDAVVIEHVKQAARRQGVTDSRLVNDILRRVLGL